MDEDGGVFVDPHSEEGGVLGHRAKEPGEPAALGEVLIDDDPPEEAETGSHAKRAADLVGGLAVAPISMVSLITEVPAQVPAMVPPSR